MTNNEGQHVFISYVREDKECVDRLCEMLKAAQIPFWRDLKNLEPGDDWKIKIKEAIRNNSLVFLACFSDNSRNRPRNNMNEELHLAVEEFRRMPPGETWIIPIRFDDGSVPDWGIGANRSLNDINRVDLFGDSYPEQAVALTNKINRLMGANENAATTLAFVEESRSQERPELLRRLTKEMIVNPAKQIELDDLIAGEVRSALETLNDDPRYGSQVRSGTNEDQIRNFVQLASETWEAVRPFCYSLAIAARWGTADSLSPWTAGIKNIVSAASKHHDGYESINNVRHIAAVAVIAVAALASTAYSRWDNFKTLLAGPRVPENYHVGSTIGVLDATGYWKPFDTSASLPSIFSRAETSGDDPVELFNQYNNRQLGKLHTPIPDWLHSVMKPIFEWTEEEHTQNYHLSELMLGVVGQDVSTQDALNQGHNAQYARSNWFGRSTWALRHASQSPVDQLRSKLEREGASGALLQAGLFGGDLPRALSAIDKYNEDYREYARRISW
ncbi:toll/interleukin-1 receptor domain-containing protein [Glutamicibacter sp. NPDC087661]|uniref:toll/interleukin-1 receptor domain-containing protein n=1 Tax=Glutamicibacter sp. NPDC087661 TaxID=3363996 RepID=UPI00382B72F8